MMTPNELKFENFKLRWFEEISGSISLSSNPNDYYTSAYLDIIGMKYDALPCILNELVKEGEEARDWFFALAMITHVNPVPRELRGNRKEMARKWIDWGYEKGIIKPSTALESLKQEIKQKFTEPKISKPKAKKTAVSVKRSSVTSKKKIKNVNSTN